MAYTKEELCFIWLDSFLGLEYKHKAELYKYINGKTDIKEIITCAKDYIVQSVGEDKFNLISASSNQAYLNYIIDGLNRRGIIAITGVSKNYPESLKNLTHPPFVLYAKGDVSLLDGKIFAIVGSRKSLPLSTKIAERYTEALSSAKYTLITGIAEGVDGTVLKTALENNGKVISVVAGGFDNVYPKSNQDLFNKVAERGLVISEYPPETVPMRFHFPVRNRIIAGLAKGVLVVSGAIKSGTLYTAEYAEEYGKDLFAIPYSIGVESGAGCNDLIKRGAILTDKPQDILDYYGETDTLPRQQFSEQEKQILRILKDGEMHVEKLSGALNKRAFEITPLLSILEIKGVVVKSGNIYGLAVNYSEE